MSNKTIVLKPGEYSLIGFGSGVPKGDLPKRCLTCRRVIRRGERWVSTDNGEYRVIRHRACVGLDPHARS